MNVPKLRFPEFRNAGEWAEKTLGQVAKYENGKAHEQDIAEMGDFIVVNSKFISTDGKVKKFTNTAFCIAEKDDILMVLSDLPNGRALAKCFFVDADDLYTVNQRICKITPNKAVGTMLFYTLNRNPYFLAFDDGVKQTNLKNEDVLNCQILLPKDSKEQQKIADCLSSIDELITAQSQKLDSFKVHKKGLMQKLFPAEGETVPKLRFPDFRDAGDWKKLPIGEKVDLFSGYPFKSSEISEDATGIPLMRGINITEGYIRHSQDIDRFFLGTTKKLEKYRLRTNDLVIGMDGSKVGKNSALITEEDSDSLLIQRVARLRTNNKGTIQFIFQQINSVKFHSYVGRINTSGGIPHISADQINEFEICFPDFEEQQKIADCLSSIDELIGAQSQKLDALKVHKKGLMQQLFPTTNYINK